MSHTEALGVHLPKLPELDTEDIIAVRSFLPGKLLGRTAALLSLLLLVIGFVAVLDQELKRLYDVDLSPMPWLHYGLLLGFPLLAVVSQLLVEGRAERSRRALQRLAVRIGAEQSGYFRIGPYLSSTEDRTRFHRADRAHEKVLAWMGRSFGVPLYLTGDSGSGKTSLMNAYVLPALRERGWMVVEARAWQDPEATLREALAQLLGARRPRQTDRPALRALIEAAARRADGGLLIVLDQFEEFVILGKPEQKEAFAALLADLRAIPVERLSLLLVLRSDYQTFLEDIGLPPLRQGENLYQVGRFMFAAASDFLAGSGLELQPAAIDHLLTSAAELDETPGLVRPITLNVVGYVLATGKAVAPSLDAGQLVRRYIEQTVGQPAIRDFAPQVLEQLVTEQGTKRPRSEHELTTLTHLRRAELRAVLNGLGAASLARPLDPEQGVWELSHDFIARAVARYLGRRRRQLLRRGAAYAAPALLTATLLVATGAIAWDRLSAYRIRSELAELGLAVSFGGKGAVGNFLLTNEGLVQAGPLLATLTELDSLSMEDNPKIENLEPINGLTTLHSLGLKGTKVENLGPLKGLTELHYLDLSGTRVENLEPVRGLTALGLLRLGGTKVENLEPINGLIALYELNLSGTRVGDLRHLKGLTALQELNLSGTKVTNLEPLRGLTALKSLNLRGTEVRNLEPLEDLAALESLYLSASVPEAELIRFERYRRERTLQSVEILRR